MAKQQKFESIGEVIEIEAHGKSYELDLAKVGRLMMIDPAHLNEELQEQAAFYYWVASLATAAQFEVEDAQQAFDIFYAELVREKREELTPKEGKAPAASLIEAEAKADEEYAERIEGIGELRRKAAYLATVRDAVRMRQYTLIERSRRLSRDEAAESEG